MKEKNKLYFTIPGISDECDTSERLDLDFLLHNDVDIYFKESENQTYNISAEFDGRFCSITLVDMSCYDGVLFIDLDTKNNSAKVSEEEYTLSYSAEQIVCTLAQVVKRFVENKDCFKVVTDIDTTFYEMESW